MPALPYSKKRYYLSGIDWIISTLNSYMCSTTPAGNHSTLILELAGKLNTSSLRAQIDTIYYAVPMLSARIVRDRINLAPYFRKASGQHPNYDFYNLEIDSKEELDSAYITVLNRPFTGKRCYLSFTYILCGDRNLLCMTFDHRILDARGAELFLNLLSDMSGEELQGRLAGIKINDAPQLREWSEKFAAGRTVQRKIITLTQEGCFTPSRRTMNDISKTTAPNLIPCFHHFSEDETVFISAESEKCAGFMMETPYLLAVTSLALYKSSRIEDEVNFFVPVPIDMRKKGEESRHLFCNHLSFLFFYFEVTPETTQKELICEIRSQMFTQIAEEFPEDMIKAAYPGRIFPLWFLKRVMRFPFKGKMSSFVFANVGAASFTGRDIAGTPVSSMYHMPRIPTPPGTGVFFSRYNDRLHLTISSDQYALDKGFGDALKQRIVAKLLNTQYAHS